MAKRGELHALEQGERLGHGGEATVYALGDDRVVRIHHPGATLAAAQERAALLAELGASATRVPFAIPEVLETRVLDERVVTIERRLPGRPLSELLTHAQGVERTAWIERYLEAATQVGALSIPRPYFGELVGTSPVRTRSFREYLFERARRSLSASGAFDDVDARALAAELPEPGVELAGLLHLDFFPGNMLVDAGRITAVLDFGASAVFGDRRLEPLTAAAYLEAPITAGASAADRAVARAWLAERGLDGWFAPARRWVAAFWTHARDDRPLRAWCRSILSGP